MIPTLSTCQSNIKKLKQMIVSSTIQYGDKMLDLDNSSSLAQSSDLLPYHLEAEEGEILDLR